MASVLETYDAAVTSADGTKLWSAQAGRPASETAAIVFIPGFSCSSLMFEHQFRDESLLSKFCLITFEPRGQGRSGDPVDASSFAPQRLAEDFDAVCKHYGATSIYLAGWSAGFLSVTDIFAHLSSTYLKGAISLAGPVVRQSFVEFALPLTIETVGALMQVEDGDRIAQLIPRFLDGCVYEPHRANMSYTLRMVSSAVVGLQKPRNRQWMEIGHIQDSTALKRDGCNLPVLAIIGDMEETLSPDRLEAHLVEFFPNMQVLHVKDAGHSVFWEKPKEVNRAIEEFVKHTEKQ